MKYIISGDNHIRPDKPLCFVGDDGEWQVFQESVMNFLVDKANEHKANILFPGDLTDVPRVPNEIMAMFFRAMSRLDGEAFIQGGNHSLPHHREAGVFNSSVGLIKALNHDRIHYCDSVEELIDGRFEHSHKLNDDITMIHTLCYPTEEDIPFAFEAVSGDYILDKYDTRWCITGDAHKPFIYKKGKRAVINSGKMTVQKTSEMDKPPVCYLLDTDTGEITEILLPHDPTKVSNEHITKKKEYDESLESAIKLLQEVGDDTTLDYVANLMVYCDKNKASLGARDIINEIREEK